MILDFTYTETVWRSMLMDTQKLYRAMEVWIYGKSDTYISICMQAALSTLLKLWKSTNSMRAELETSALECAKLQLSFSDITDSHMSAIPITN